MKAPAQKEVYCAPPGEDTNGSRDAESHQLAVYSNCPPDTKPTNVKHKITTYNQDHAFLHIILSLDLIIKRNDRRKIRDYLTCLAETAYVKIYIFSSLTYDIEDPMLDSFWLQTLKDLVKLYSNWKFWLFRCHKNKKYKISGWHISVTELTLCNMRGFQTRTAESLSVITVACYPL